jgi:hypothetical protein
MLTTGVPVEILSQDCTDVGQESKTTAVACTVNNESSTAAPEFRLRKEFRSTQGFNRSTTTVRELSKQWSTMIAQALSGVHRGSVGVQK